MRGAHSYSCVIQVDCKSDTNQSNEKQDLVTLTSANSDISDLSPNYFFKTKDFCTVFFFRTLKHCFIRKPSRISTKALLVYAFECHDKLLLIPNLQPCRLSACYQPVIAYAVAALCQWHLSMIDHKHTIHQTQVKACAGYY